MKKKVHFAIPLCISLCLIYVILAARPLGKELHFTPRWTIDISRPLAKAHTKDKDEFADAIPFKLAQTLGYMNADGKILYDTTFSYKATLTKTCYATYGTNSSPIFFYNSDGSLAGKINSTGFPFFTEDGMYLFLPGGSSFAKLSENGAIEWTYESYAPITAFGTSRFGCVAGFSDGTIVSFAADGTIDQRLEPAGSNYPVILGVALSDSGSMIASVCGQETQRFVLAKKNNGHTEIIYYERLEHELTRQVPVMFSKNELYVYYNCADGLGVVNTEEAKGSHIKLSGKILSIKEAESSNNVYMLSKDNDSYTVSVVQPFDTHAGSFSFKAQSAFIAVKDNALFVGKDGTISRMDVVQK